MALIRCPECEGKVSDKATSCPHCGFPISSTPTPKRGRPPKPPINMQFRLPNGYGTVKTLKGNRRKPHMAYVNPRLMLNEDKGTTYYVYDCLGAYADKMEAYTAVMEYNKNPGCLQSSLTIKELFDKWCPYYVAENNYEDFMRRRYETLFDYCTPLYKVRVVDATPALLKNTIDNATRIGSRGHDKGKVVTASPDTKGRLKGLLNMLFDYAVFLRIVTINYARTFEIKTGEIVRREGNPYTEDERNILWKHAGTFFIDASIVQFYSGWRPGEVMNLTLDSVNLQNLTFTGGSKTAAGTNRTIPIHSKIVPIVEQYYNNAINCKRPILFGRTTPLNGSFIYSDNCFRYGLLKELGLLGIANHTPHDGRHTFSTLAKAGGMDDYARKKIMGHAIKDLTDKVYTHLDIEWFRSEIEKII